MSPSNSAKWGDYAWWAAFALGVLIGYAILEAEATSTMNLSET